MRKVFLSRMLSPEDCRSVKTDLRKLNPNIQFVESEADGNISLFVTSKQEIMSGTYDHWYTLTVTPLSVTQLCRKNINPLTFRESSALVNTFLLRKKINISYIPREERMRISEMIKQMGGDIADTLRVDFILSKTKMDPISSAIIVDTSWIEALFGSKIAVSYDKFRMENESKSQSQSSNSARRSRGHIPGRLDLKVETPNSVGNTHTTEEKGKKGRSFIERLSEIVPSPPRKTNSKKIEDIISLIEISDSDITEEEQIRQPQKIDDEEIQTRERIEPPSMEEEPEEHKIEEEPEEHKITVQRKPKELDDLCQSLMKAKPTKRELEVPLNQDSLWAKLNEFSQVEPSQREAIFNIEWDNAAEDSGEDDGCDDTLFNALFSQRRD